MKENKRVGIVDQRDFGKPKEKHLRFLHMTRCLRMVLLF